MMLTAAHCFWGSDTTSDAGLAVDLYGNGARVGTSTNYSHEEWDAALINDQGYLNPVYNDCSSCDGYTPVLDYTGWQGLHEVICVQGGYTGRRCGKVTDPSRRIRTCAHDSGTQCRDLDNVVEISAPAGYYLAGPGDSGSTVTKHVDGGVNVLGILSSVNSSPIYTGTCPAFATIGGTPRQCSEIIYAEQFSRFFDAFSPPLTLNPPA